MNREQNFDVKNLSSRKLWELLSTDSRWELSCRQQQLAEQELRQRRHYLEQLEAWRQSATLYTSNNSMTTTMGNAA